MRFLTAGLYFGWIGVLTVGGHAQPRVRFLTTSFYFGWLGVLTVGGHAQPRVRFLTAGLYFGWVGVLNVGGHAQLRVGVNCCWAWSSTHGPLIGKVLNYINAIY